MDSHPCASTRAGTKSVLLLSMPFGMLDRPAIGISLLKSALASRQIACAVRYPTFLLAEMIGVDAYTWIACELAHRAYVGEWVFSHALYGHRPEADEAYVNEILVQGCRFDEATIRRILSIRPAVLPFLDRCLETIPWRSHDVIGFTCTFEQNMASLCLAARIKELDPSKVIVFGGASWESEMGVELSRHFPFVDYVCSGEADVSFPALVERLSRGDVPLHEQPVPGVVYKHDGQVMLRGEAEVVTDLDTLPLPDYTDYVAAHAAASFEPQLEPTLLVETSRGCWWGARERCTFCALNARKSRYRSKSPQRALDEIVTLRDAWPAKTLHLVDNILNMTYFERLLPAIADRELGLSLFFEVKANLTRAQVDLMRRAGVTAIEAGIESLSDRLLERLRKGSTALENVQLLKWCRSRGIRVTWNMLYGVPGDTRQDYDGILTILRAIRHLEPPTAIDVRLMRYSPLFNDPEGHGLVNIQPFPSYKHIYPFGDESLSRIAYLFTFDFADGEPHYAYAADVVRFVQDWRARPETGSLVGQETADGVLALTDTRSNSTPNVVHLQGPDKATYLFCDQARSLPEIVQMLQATCGLATVDEAPVGAFLSALVAAGLMVTDGQRFLGTALLPPDFAVEAPTTA